MQAAFPAYVETQQTISLSVTQDLNALIQVFEGDVTAEFLGATFRNLQTGIIYKDVCLVFVRFLAQLPAATRTFLMRKFLVIAMTGCGNNQIRLLLGSAAPGEDVAGRQIYERWLAVADKSLPLVARSRVPFQSHDPQLTVRNQANNADVQLNFSELWNQYETVIRALPNNNENNALKAAANSLKGLSPLSPKLASIIGSYIYLLVLNQRLSTVVSNDTANTFNQLMVGDKFQAGAGFLDDRTVVHRSGGNDYNVVVPVVLGLMAIPEVAIALFPHATHANFLARLVENSYGATIGISMYLNRSGNMNLSDRERTYSAWNAVVLKARTNVRINGILTPHDAQPLGLVQGLVYLKAQRLEGVLVSSIVDDANVGATMTAVQRPVNPPAANA